MVTTEESRNIEIEWRNDGQTYVLETVRRRFSACWFRTQMTSTSLPIGRCSLAIPPLTSATLVSDDNPPPPSNHPKPKPKPKSLFYTLRATWLVYARRPGTGAQRAGQIRAEEWPCLFPVVEPPSAASCRSWGAPWPFVSAPDAAVVVAAAAEAPRCQLQPRSLSLPPVPLFLSERVSLSPLLRLGRLAFG
jgi:hypothetical protein